jgi:coproporphyrinogen III oxidase
MTATLATKRTEIETYLKDLRNRIVEAFESLEPVHRFKRTPWEYQSGQGGGEMSVIRGDVFEKAAVNWSGVHGANFPTNESSGPFYATGVSLITHMNNPHMPTVHMNIRYIETENKWWFGGGYDMTPMGFPYEEDNLHFHQTAKETLQPFGDELYKSFAEQAAHYYYIQHRKKERGVGGIFFDHYNSGDPDRDFAMWKQVGDTFLDAIMPIYLKRKDTPYTIEDKEIQQRLRAHYVEFNLIYDRGTKFGFQSGGNPEAILCSMPPCAKW